VFAETASEMEAIPPTDDFAASAVTFLLPATATGDVNLAVSAGRGGGGTTFDANATGLGFECFTFSGVEAGGRDGEDATDSAAFDFFAFSGVEAEVVKGADCWLAFRFEERSWVVGC
jgi:hypothetical protein